MIMTPSLCIQIRTALALSNTDPLELAKVFADTRSREFIQEVTSFIQVIQVDADGQCISHAMKAIWDVVARRTVRTIRQSVCDMIKTYARKFPDSVLDGTEAAIEDLQNGYNSTACNYDCPVSTPLRIP
jgi:hypothetical protein